MPPPALSRTRAVDDDHEHGEEKGEASGAKRSSQEFRVRIRCTPESVRRSTSNSTQRQVQCAHVESRHYVPQDPEDSPTMPSMTPRVLLVAVLPGRLRCHEPTCGAHAYVLNRMTITTASTTRRTTIDALTRAITRRVRATPTTPAQARTPSRTCTRSASPGQRREHPGHWELQ